MQPCEGSRSLRRLATDVKNHPSNFGFAVNVSVIGTSVVQRGPGTGLSVQVTGGAPGSTTIGFQSTVNTSNTQLPAETAQRKLAEQVDEVVGYIDSIAAELNEDVPNTGRIRSFFQSLKQVWVPQLITSAVSNILSQCIGGIWQ